MLRFSFSPWILFRRSAIRSFTRIYITPQISSLCIQRIQESIVFFLCLLSAYFQGSQLYLCQFDLQTGIIEAKLVHRLDSSLLSGLDTGQSVLDGLNLAKLSLEFLQISLMILLDSQFPADHRHAGSQFSVVIIFLRLPQILDPAKHPVFPDSQEANLLEEKLFLIRRHGIGQAPLRRIQAIITTRLTGGLLCGYKPLLPASA